MEAYITGMYLTTLGNQIHLNLKVSSKFPNHLIEKIMSLPNFGLLYLFLS